MRKYVIFLSAFIYFSSAKAQSSLTKAIKDKNAAQVEAEIKNGAHLEWPIELKSGKNTSPFLFAVMNSSPEVIEVLLKYKADQKSHIQYYSGLNALQAALLVGKSEENAEVLLKHGYTINELSPTGFSSFDLAITNKNPTAITWLMEHKADINIKNHMNRTPLLSAISRSDEPVFTYLLKNGADRNGIDYIGNTALGLALLTQKIEDKKFAENPKADADIYEIESSDLEFIIDTLTDLKVAKKPDQATLDKFTLVERAQRAIIINDSIGFFKAMTDGAYIEGKNRKGQTLLALALEHNRPAMAKFLIKNDANVNVLDALGDDLLMSARKRNNLLTPALITPTGKFSRYPKNATFPVNKEGENYLEVAKFGYNYSGFWIWIMNDFETVTDPLQLLPTWINIQGYPYYETANPTDLPFYETIADVHQLYADMPATNANGLLGMALNFNYPSIVQKVITQSKNLDKQKAFAQALVYGNIPLAKQLFENKANNIDINALTENFGAMSPKNISLYHWFANMYSVRKGDPQSVLMALLEMGDITHEKKVSQVHRRESYKDQAILPFLDDARKMTLEQLKAKYPPAK